MSAIELSSFIAAAQIDNGPDKLTVSSGAVKERQATTAVGGKIISWVKLNTTGDAQKTQDQALFKAALKEKYGPDIGEAAYKAFATSDNKMHSLTKSQVISSVIHADELQTKFTKATNTAILEGVSERYGEDVATEVLARATNGALSNQIDANPTVAREKTDVLAEEIAGRRLEWIQEDIDSNLARLEQPDVLRSMAEESAIPIDWENVGTEELSTLHKNLKEFLEAQTKVDPFKPDFRDFLADDHVDQAARNQLRVLAAAQRAQPDQPLFAEVLAQLGVDPKDVSDEVLSTLKDDVNRELQIVLGPDGTRTVQDNLDPRVKGFMLESLTFALAKPLARELGKAPDFQKAIAEFKPEGDAKKTEYADKWLPDLALQTVLLRARANDDLAADGGLVNVLQTELAIRLDKTFEAHKGIEGVVNALSDPDFDVEALANSARLFSNNASAAGGDDIPKVIGLHLNKIFVETPAKKEALLKAVEDGILSKNVNAVGAGVELLKQSVEVNLLTRLGNKEQSARIAELEAESITSAMNGPLFHLLAPLLNAIYEAEKVPAIEGKADIEQLNAQAKSENDEALSVNAEKEARYNTIIHSYSTPNRDPEGATKVARGLVSAFAQVFEDNGLELSF